MATYPPPAYLHPRPYHPPLKPYLGPRAHLSLSWLSQSFLALVLLLVALAFLRAQIPALVGDARASLTAACARVEGAATVAVSLPHYMADGVNEVNVRAVNALSHGAGTVLDLMLQALEAIVLFMIDMYRSLFLCLLDLAVHGSITVLVKGIEEAQEFVTEALGGVRNAIQESIGGVNTLIDHTVGLIDDIPGVDLDVPQIDIPELSALENVTLPDTLINALRDLNSTIPTLDEFRSGLDSLVSTPIEALRSSISETLRNSTIDVELLPVPPKERVSFCQDLDTSWVDDVGTGLGQFAAVAIGLVLLAMVLLTAANALWARYRYRAFLAGVLAARDAWLVDLVGGDAADRQAHAQTVQETLSTPNLLSFLNASSHPALARLISRASSLLRLETPAAKANLVWFLSYVAHPYAWAFFALGAVGLVVVQVQLAVLDGPVRRLTRDKAEKGAGEFSTSVAATMNAKMEVAAAEWANGTNRVIMDAQDGINENLFGWVNDTTTALNSTMNGFYAEITDAVTSVFNGTILEDPALGLVYCLIGSKVDAVSTALTWLHQHAHLSLPTVSPSLLTLSPNRTDDLTAALTDPISTVSAPSIADRMLDAYRRSLEQQRLGFALALALWVLVLVMGLGGVWWRASGEAAWRRGRGRRPDEREDDDEVPVDEEKRAAGPAGAGALFRPLHLASQSASAVARACAPGPGGTGGVRPADRIPPAAAPPLPPAHSLQESAPAPEPGLGLRLGPRGPYLSSCSSGSDPRAAIPASWASLVEYFKPTLAAGAPARSPASAPSLSRPRPHRAARLAIISRPSRPLSAFRSVRDSHFASSAVIARAWRASGGSGAGGGGGGGDAVPLRGADAAGERRYRYRLPPVPAGEGGWRARVKERVVARARRMTRADDEDGWEEMRNEDEGAVLGPRVHLAAHEPELCILGRTLSPPAPPSRAMVPLAPPVPPPRPPSPLAHDPASAVATPASPGARTPGAPYSAAKPRRNVQWNELVSEHVAIPFYSERAPDADSTEPPLIGSGSRSAGRGRRGTVVRRATVQLDGAPSGSNDPFSDRYRLDDVPISLAGGQVDGALDGIVAPVVKQLEVWVDPLERDGLPTLAAVDGGGEGPAHNTIEDKAHGLVSAYAEGARGLWQGLSRRRASIIAMREKEDDAREKGRQSEDQLQSADVDTGPHLPGAAPGILGALIALQQQEAELARQGSASVSSSAVPTPAPSTPSSPTLHPLSTAPSSADDDSSDEEVERERFIARLREKRASKNALHAASSSVASASKHAGGAAIRFAKVKGERGRSSTPSSRPQSVSDRSVSRSRASSPASSPRGLSPFRRPASLTSAAPDGNSSAPPSPSLSAHHRSRSATSLVQLKGGDPGLEPKSELAQHHRSQSHNALSRLLSHTIVSHLSQPSHPDSPASPSSPPPPVGMAIPHKTKLTSEFTKRVRKVGDRLGLEWETDRTRPDAARSSAGVFGGLILGAAALAAPATPSGTSVAPLPTRPGYNLSRYSAPDIHQAVRSSSPTPPRTQPPSPGILPSRGTLSTAPSPASTILKPSPTPSRKSLSEMVREEEVKEQSGQGSEPTLRERRRHGRRAVFSLQVNDIPSATEEEHEPDSASSRPTLTIDTSASTRSNSPSPTSATFRFFGPRTPKSAPGSFGSLNREYFGSGTLSPTLTPAERERDRALRKAREEAEREAKERERDLREWHKEKRRRRKAREKELKRRRVFIKEHVAAILERQQFILKLARAFMMFGAPSHRLEAQIQATARVLELPHCSALYLPGVILVNFGDPATCTSDIKFLKQAAGLDLGKLKSTYYIYHKVIRDKISVAVGSAELDDLMTSPPKYGLLKNILVGGLAGAFIMPSAFGGSFVDCVAAIPLGGLLVVVQVLLSRNDMYSSLFEIVIACINAIIAAALSRTNQLCFYSVAAGSIVLILPGFIVLCAALELANRSIISGAVRLTYAALYALFLGFGLSLGAEIYTKSGREQITGGGDYTCAYLRRDAPWWRQTIPRWWYFLTIPMFLLCMALKNGQPLFRRDTVAMVAIGCAGFSANFFSGWEFVNMPALTSFIGSFVVGLLGNAWSKMTRESAFVSMVVGIFVQLPSGLANGGLLRFAADAATTNTRAFGTAIDAAAGLIRISVGMTVGLFLAAAVVNLLSRRGRGRGSHLSTF
ncbi:hypothetical protein JCM3770_002004 [Rhodotorula araucariae]